MRSLAVNRPFVCWLSIAFDPPPPRIFSSSLRTCETRSAMNRMLASNFADVGSTLDGSRVEEAFDCETSLRSAIFRVPQTDYVKSAAHGAANPANPGEQVRPNLSLHGGVTGVPPVRAQAR